MFKSLIQALCITVLFSASVLNSYASGVNLQQANVAYVVDLSKNAVCTVSLNGRLLYSRVCASGSALQTVTTTYSDAVARSVTEFVVLSGDAQVDMQRKLKLLQTSSLRAEPLSHPLACTPGNYVQTVTGSFSSGRRVDYETRYNRGNTCIITDITDRARKNTIFQQATTWTYSDNNTTHAVRNKTISYTGWTAFETLNSSTSGQSFSGSFALGIEGISLGSRYF